MRILFLGRHYGYFRNFESVLRALASHGHAIHLAVEREETHGGTRLVARLAAEYPTLTHGTAPGREDDDRTWAAGRLRLGLDYLRYQHRVFDEAYKLRARARARTPSAFVALGDAVHAAGGWSRAAASAMLRRLERAVPEDPAIPAFLEEQRPDVVLLTPLIDLGSSQIDYLRAARARGIPTALCVWSWDHLSSKALIRESPDRVFVWNHTQKREAIELHGVPDARVVVTGAQCFDQWFDRAPSRGRAQFCRDAGLPPDRPILLYACSALIHGSPIEAVFVAEWIRRLRASVSPALREAAILVRPHPSRIAEWEGVDLREWGAVVWGANPVDAQAKADYFDSLYYCAAVAGLNTSAFIEAGIVGRPVHAIVVPQFEENQYGTVHFRYLVNAGGGLLHVARDFDEHFRQLDAALATPVTEVRPFVREFVRPAGLDRAATPIFVDAVEEMGGLRPARARVDALLPVWRWALDRLTRARTNVRLERWTLSAREFESAERIRRLHEDKAIRRAEARAASDAERTRKLQIRAARLEEARRQRSATGATEERRRAEKAARHAQKRRLA